MNPIELLKKPFESITNDFNEVKNNAFYASKLIKMSAKQYAFLSSNPQPYTPSLAMYIGNAMADYVLKEFPYHEMGGCVENFINDYKIYFSNDAVNYDAEENVLDICEHKFFYKNELDDWKIKSSYSQSLFYASLSGKVNSMRTSPFYKMENANISFKKGFKVRLNLIISTQDSIYFYQEIPNKKTLNKIFNFYIKKGSNILDAVNKRLWDGVKLWDEELKHKEHLEFAGKFSIENMTKIF